MRLLDKLKRTAKTGVDKAKDLAEEHGEKIEGGIDKVADFADKRTKGKHRDKIRKGADKAKGAVDQFADEGGEGGEAGEAGSGA